MEETDLEKLKKKILGEDDSPVSDLPEKKEARPASPEEKAGPPEEPVKKGLPEVPEEPAKNEKAATEAPAEPEEEKSEEVPETRETEEKPPEESKEPEKTEEVPEDLKSEEPEEQEDVDEKPVEKRSLFGKLRPKKKAVGKGKGVFKKKGDMKQSIVRGVDLKEGNVDYDENVITPDEFAAIEETEDKPVEEEVQEKPRATERRFSEASAVDQLMMKMERMEGRMTAVNEMNRAVQERITGLSEEIGELRSSILEKERTINEIESQSKRVMDSFEEIEPENFRKELEKKEEEITKNQAGIESLLMRQKETKDTLEKLKAVMEKVKSFENLVEMSGKINEKLSQIEENKKYTSRLASKAENIFSELNNRMKEFKSSIEKVEMNDETIKELMKSVDVIEIKVEKVVTKDQLEKIEKELKEEISNNKTELEDKLYDLKDFLEDVVTKAGGIKLLKSKEIMPWRIELENRMKQVEKLLGGSGKTLDKVEEFRTQMEGLRKDVKRLDKLTGESREEEPEKKVFSPREAPPKKVSPGMEIWIRDNLRKGYSAEDLKESLRTSGNDPSLVDRFVGSSRKKHYVID